jgi:major membrane immunogen (membrane-anchored lipoprotein)
MKKILTLTMIAALSITSFVGCSKPTTTDNSKPTTTDSSKPTTTDTKPAATDTSKDGTFKAEDKDFDAHGYKGQVSVTFKDGKITNVVFDEVTKDGKKKRDDAAYNTQMKAGSKVSAVEAQDKLAKTYLDSQKTDTVTGATEMSARFKTLVEQAVALRK